MPCASGSKLDTQDENLRLGCNPPGWGSTFPPPPTPTLTKCILGIPHKGGCSVLSFTRKTFMLSFKKVFFKKC